MVDRSNIFRAAALERLSSPERLDTLMQVVRPRAWIPLGTFAALAAAALAWSVCARIPVEAVARGVLVRPGSLCVIEAPGSGLVTSLAVHAGDVVKKGQLLGTIDDPELRARVDRACARLEQLDGQHAAAAALEDRSAAVERQAIAARRVELLDRIAEAEKRDVAQTQADAQGLEAARATARSAVASARELVATAKERREALGKTGAREEELMDARRGEAEAEGLLLDLQAREREVERRAADAERAHEERRDRIARLRDGLPELDARENALARQALASNAAYARTRADAEAELAALGRAAQEAGRITSASDGQVLELSVAVGSRVTAGARIGLASEGTRAQGLACVAFVAAKDGKRLVPGTDARVELDAVERTRDGGMLGHVVSVAPYPVSVDAAAASLGSVDLARSVAGEGARIQITIELARDAATPSGYAWSSTRGPEIDVTAGTTATVRLRLEERAPIAFVLPHLRAFLGL